MVQAHEQNGTKFSLDMLLATIINRCSRTLGVLMSINSRYLVLYPIFESINPALNRITCHWLGISSNLYQVRRSSEGSRPSVLLSISWDFDETRESAQFAHAAC